MYVVKMLCTCVKHKTYFVRKPTCLAFQKRSIEKEVNNGIEAKGAANDNAVVYTAIVYTTLSL